MKDSYEKPSMTIETVDIPVLADQSGSPVNGGGEGPIAQLQPYFGLCCT